MNFFKHHIGDYDSATMHLSWDEDMAYTRLMRVYYRDEKPIPLDPAKACRLIRAQSRNQKAAIIMVLGEFFERREDGWHNKRCDEEIATAAKQAAVNRQIAEERETKRARNGHESLHGSSTNGSTIRPPIQTPDSTIQTPLSKSHSHSEAAGGIVEFGTGPGKKRLRTADEIEAEEISRAQREGRSANV